jgi:anti-sigma regulatory factor (Ser/Thr protein kinase)
MRRSGGEEETMSSDLHSAAGVPAITTWLDPSLSAPARARRFARDVLEGTGAAQESVQVAELLVSELATNAVVHAGTPALLSVSVTDGAAHIEIADDGPGEPRLRPQAPGDEGGYGMRLIDRLAWSWGVDRRPGDGKTVWLNLRLVMGPARLQCCP